jgi:hypothetical protein
VAKNPLLFAYSYIIISFFSQLNRKKSGQVGRKFFQAQKCLKKCQKCIKMMQKCPKMTVFSPFFFKILKNLWPLLVFKSGQKVGKSGQKVGKSPKIKEKLRANVTQKWADKIKVGKSLTAKTKFRALVRALKSF